MVTSTAMAQELSATLAERLDIAEFPHVEVSMHPFPSGGWHIRVRHDRDWDSFECSPQDLTVSMKAFAERFLAPTADTLAEKHRKRYPALRLDVAFTPEEARQRHLRLYGHTRGLGHILDDANPARLDMFEEPAKVILGAGHLYRDAQSVIHVAKERMELPEGCRRLEPSLSKPDQHTLDAGVYLSGRVPPERGGEAFLRCMNESDDPEIRRAEAYRAYSAAMQAAEHAGQIVPYDAPWSPWPAAFVVIGAIIGVGLLSAGVLHLLGVF